MMLIVLHYKYYFNFFSTEVKAFPTALRLIRFALQLLSAKSPAMIYLENIQIIFWNLNLVTNHSNRSGLTNTDIFAGRPEATEGSEAKEIKVYDLLDYLGIHYLRVDHAPFAIIMLHSA